MRVKSEVAEEGEQRVMVHEDTLHDGRRGVAQVNGWRLRECLLEQGIVGKQSRGRRCTDGAGTPAGDEWGRGLVIAFIRFSSTWFGPVIVDDRCS